MKKIFLLFALWVIFLPAASNAATVHRHARMGDAQEMQKLLSQHRSEASRYSISGKQPLHIAAIWGKTDTAETLLKHGAPVDGRTRALRRTPLFFAVRNQQVALAERLLAAGADPDAHDVSGKTPMRMARRGNKQAQVDMVALLEKFRAKA